MYCGSGLKKDLIVVVLVISLLSNFTVFDSFEGKLIGLNDMNLFYKMVNIFLTASKYCGGGLKIDLVVVILAVVLVIKLLSNWTAFFRFNVINIFRIT